MNPKLKQSIEAKKLQLDELRPFSPAVLSRLRDEMIIEWTYNSNAIEGSTLTLRETAMVLNQGITIAGKPLRDHLETVNHKSAILELRQFVDSGKDFDAWVVKRLHTILFQGSPDARPGSYRNERVRIMGAFHIPPDPRKIERLMSELETWYQEASASMHPVDLAAQLHHKLVHIHPFIDGNGRTTRLVTNLILMRFGYPPAVILRVDRRRYYRVLAAADMGNDAQLRDFVARSVERSLIIYLRALTPATSVDFDRQGYVSLAEAADQSAFNKAYLSLLARKGRLEAVKFGRNWMTTHDAVAEYAASRDPRGRPRKQ